VRGTVAPRTLLGFRPD